MSLHIPHTASPRDNVSPNIRGIIGHNIKPRIKTPTKRKTKLGIVGLTYEYIEIGGNLLLVMKPRLPPYQKLIYTYILMD
jgi:hypothetical protein